MNIPYRGSKGPLHLLIDSTGIKVEGEGEWHARKHGGPKRRVWRESHLGIDEETLEIRAADFTISDIGDAPILPDLLGQIPEDEQIGSVTADGAYDTRKCHDAIAERCAHAVRALSRTGGVRALTPTPQECEAVEDRHCRSHGPKRSPARREISRPRALATMERLSPREPRRDMRRIRKRSGGSFSRRLDALCETAGRCHQSRDSQICI